MKRFFSATFSLFLLFTLLTVTSVADLGEGLTIEEQQTEVFEETEVITEEDFIPDDESDFKEEPSEESEATGAESDKPADEEADKEPEEIAEEEDEEEKDYLETISLDSDIEEAIFQIRNCLAFLNYGIIPLISSSVVAYLFYKFIMNTF